MRNILILMVLLALITTAGVWYMNKPKQNVQQEVVETTTLPEAPESHVVLAVTEDNAPLSYLEGGTVTGQATQLVREVLETADLKYTIELYPWARAYSIANNTPNALIYSMARTPEREALFKWVGAIAPRRYVLYRLENRTDITAATLAEAKSYTIGVVKDDVRAKYLISEGVAVDEVTDDAQNLHKLVSGRIDMFPISPSKLIGLCEHEGVDCSRLAPVFELDFHPDLYMAFSLATPDETVERARRAYQELTAAGALERILPTYWEETEL